MKKPKSKGINVTHIKAIKKKAMVSCGCKRYPTLLEVAWTIAIMVATAFITILYTK